MNETDKFLYWEWKRPFKKQCEQVYYTAFQKMRSVDKQQNKEEVYGNAGWGGKLWF